MLAITESNAGIMYTVQNLKLQSLKSVFFAFFFCVRVFCASVLEFDVKC